LLDVSTYNFNNPKTTDIGWFWWNWSIEIMGIILVFIAYKIVESMINDVRGVYKIWQK
jgi:hypothetical protein